MEGERDREEFKHVCRLCSKRYPSGKSLGGHMRSHVIADARKNKQLLLAAAASASAASLNAKKVQNFAAVNDENENDNENDDDEYEDDDEADIGDRNNIGGGHSGYGLRENPKKTWRMVDSHNTNKDGNFPAGKLLQNSNFNGNGNGGQERVCKQCGKGFHSLKALCGHMSIHSDKDRNFKEEDEHSWSSDSKDQLFLAMESHSDNNNNNNNGNYNYNSKRQTRSSLSRYNRSSLNSTAVDSINTNGAGSSSNHSEIDQLEQEEVAICLMMLSRDSSGSKDCFNFAAAESSDNNSVILEGGSSRNAALAAAAVAAVAAAGKVKKEKSDYKNKSKKGLDQEMDNSDSGYFENGAKELESDDSVDGFGKNYGFFNKKSSDAVGSRLADCFGDDDHHDYSRKRKGNFGFDSPDSDENYSTKRIKHDYFYTSNNNSQKVVASSSKYECWICSKSFKTHQALGGHIISHRKNGENDSNNSSAKVNNNNSNAKNLGKKGSASKKVKGHKCPYCPKVFKSGQALGGHKRSHMIGSNSVVLNHHHHVPASAAAAPQPEPEHKQPLIDLNLPAPVEEEASGGNSQFVAW